MTTLTLRRVAPGGDLRVSVGDADYAFAADAEVFEGVPPAVASRVLRIGGFEIAEPRKRKAKNG
jgi:hypothetical protein